MLGGLQLTNYVAAAEPLFPDLSRRQHLVLGWIPLESHSLHTHLGGHCWLSSSVWVGQSSPVRVEGSTIILGGFQAPCKSNGHPGWYSRKCTH